MSDALVHATVRVGPSLGGAGRPDAPTDHRPGPPDRATRTTAGLRPEARDACAAWLIALAWALVVVPRTVQSLTSPKYRTVVGVEAAPYSSLALLSDRGLTLALAGACALAVLLCLRRLSLVGAGAVVVLLLPWGAAVARDAYAGAAPGTEAVLYPLLVAALWALAPRLRAGAVIGHLTGATALLALVMGAVLPRAGVYRLLGGGLVDPEKALLPVGLLIGPFSDSNNLAQVLALGAPALLLVRRRGVALAWLVAVATALVWTSSRSSLVAVAGAALVVAALSLARQPGVRRVIAGTGGALALAILVAVPLVTAASATSGAARASVADTAFTNRGYVWRLSLQEFSEHPVVGLGTDWYGRIARYANPLGGFAYHGHNVMVQSLVTTGLVGTAVLAVLAVVALVRSAAWAGSTLAPGALFPVAHLVALSVSSTLEVSFATVDRGFLLPAALAPLALWLLARRDTGEAL